MGIELQVGDRGIEGQIAANDVNVRQLLGDSMPRLRQSLEALVGEGAGVNIELSEGDDRRAKREDSQELELSMDLKAGRAYSVRTGTGKRQIFFGMA